MKRAIFIIVSLLLVAGTSQAAQFGEIRYPDRPLNLRDGRTPKAKWVGTLQVGQKVRISDLKDGWVAVFEPYMTRKGDLRVAGYANVKYLKAKPGKIKTEPWGERMHPVTVLNVRAKRSSKSPKVGTLDPKTNILVDFPEDGWYAVFDDRATIRSKLNVIGYVKGDYLEPGPAAEPAVVRPSVDGSAGQIRSTVTPPEATEDSIRKRSEQEWGEITTIERKVIVRKKRSSKSNFVKTLKPGDRVKLGLLKDGWYAVFSPDEKIRAEHKALGYVFKRLLQPGADTQKLSGAETPAPTLVQKSETPRKMVIKANPLAVSKRPDPKADQSRHGIRFKILEKAETTRQGEDTIRLKVFVDVKKLPKAAVLEDFAQTLWKEHRMSGKLLELLIYLPEMDLGDIAFIVARYTPKEQLEFWARRTALHGTRFIQ